MRYWMIVCLLLMTIVSEAQINDVIVSVPVSGRLIFYNNSGQIYQLDTFTGQNTLLLNYDGGEISNLVLSPSGTSIAYRVVEDIDSTIFNIETMSIQELETFPNRTGLFYPLSWINNIILYYNPIIESPSTGTYTLNLMDTNTSNLTLLADYTVGQIISDFPLPLSVNQFRFRSIKNASLNPVYDEWIVLQLDGSDPTQIVTNDNGTHERIVNINLLWNYISGEMISLDHLFADVLIDQSRRLAWKPDGSYLYIPTRSAQERSFFIDIIRFRNDGYWSVEQITRSQISQVSLYDWVGAGNLFVTYNRTSGTYQLTEIIDGTLHSIDFFRLRNTTDPTIKWGDWHLSADETERHALSCLFDQAQPTRLAIGEPARVNFTNGTPLRLRTEPDLDLEPIQQIPEGTEFTVIGGPTCINAVDDYYRFWQIELADGTVGWAAEAGMSEYFMEAMP